MELLKFMKVNFYEMLIFIGLKGFNFVGIKIIKLILSVIIYLRIWGILKYWVVIFVFYLILRLVYRKIF